MSANRVPNYAENPLNPDGSWTPTWWRFFARLAAQFSGADAPVMPINPATLGLTGPPQPITPPYSPATLEALQQFGLAAFRPNVATSPDSSGQIAASRIPPAAAAIDSTARELAAIALSRSRSAPAPSGLQLIQDLLANRPAAAAFGDATVIFYATDHEELYLVQGGAWVQVMAFLSYDPGTNTITVTGSAQLAGTHAQNVGTGDSPTFAGLTITGAASGALTLTPTLTTIQYLDWSSTHQTVTVVTGIALTANNFTAGIRTT